MQTIRRLYFYLVALISVEVVLWGLINLLRTMLDTGVIFTFQDTLAQALALVLVGVPIFFFHWAWAQRSAAHDEEEHSASLRAIFLYGILVGTLVPLVQNILALTDRSVIVAAGMSGYRALIGGDQTWQDNLVAIGLNGILAGYFFTVLRSDWRLLINTENFSDVRRLYRFLWVLYSLGMMVFGAQQILSYLFSLPTTILGLAGRDLFVNGLVLLLVGAVIWTYTWTICQSAISDVLERTSNLRLGVLFFLALAGVVTVLSSGGVALDLILRRILGDLSSWPVFISMLGQPLSIGLPLGLIWAYYGRWLMKDIEAQTGEERQAGLKRLYFYILSFLGLAATFTGLAVLFSFMIDVVVEKAIWGNSTRSTLAGGISTLAVGLPLWLAAWRPMQLGALASNLEGDHSRRSIVRRTYLYLVIFVAVIGGMSSAVALAYQLISAGLGNAPDFFLSNVLNALQLLLLFSIFLIYHFVTMRQDGSRSADSLDLRQKRFPVIVFEPDRSGFGEKMSSTIQGKAPNIPVVLLSLEESLPEAVGDAQAVVLTSSLAFDPPEALRVWLKNFSGKRVVVPVTDEGWLLPGGAPNNGVDQAAKIVRQLAEGQDVRGPSGTSVWRVVVYMFAMLFGLQVLLFLLLLVVWLVTSH